MDNIEFNIVQTIIKRQLEGVEINKWNKIINAYMGVYEETSMGVHHMYTMEKTDNNHKKWENMSTDIICAKYYRPYSSFPILLLFRAWSSHQYLQHSLW